MNENYGALIGVVFVLAIIVFIVYLVVLVASVLASVAAAGGTLWGGGTALANYGASFKENIIDSNKNKAYSV